VAAEAPPVGSSSPTARAATVARTGITEVLRMSLVS
jgi:hypothetical protein